jgi:c-di-GMP-binding flagellar brake protein YcgR
MLEKRKYTRYQVNVNAIYAYMDNEGNKIQAKAKTKDISCQGVFLVTEKHLKVGTKLNVEIYLNNKVLNNMDNKSVISGIGEVVRATDFGIGIDFNYSLLKPAERIQ